MSDEVLVTGGAGFMGSHVARLLADDGYPVVVLDDLSGGFIENVDERCRFIKGSITDHELITSIFKEHKFKYVYHLAAYAAEGLSHFIKRFNYTNNLIGSINLINESVNNEVECFIFTSSIAVYGTNQLPMREDLIPAPEDSYGIAKLNVEQELKVSHEMFGLNYIIFRPHNVYGEYQNIGDRYRNVIGIFMNRFLQGLDIPIFGNGEQIRAFTYIGDVAAIIVRSVKMAEAYNEVFNIGADKPYTVNYLARVVAKAMGTEAKIHYLDERNEVKHAYSDHSKLRKVFGVYPTTSLEEGVRRMANWVKSVGSRQSKEFENIEIRKNLPPFWTSIT